MATARKIIYDGLREGNLIPANAALSATDITNAEALPLLNSFMLQLLGTVIGEEPEDWPVPPTITATGTPSWNSDPNRQDVRGETTRGNNRTHDQTYIYPPINRRLIVQLTTPTTVYLPPAPEDGSIMQITDLDSTSPLTLDGNGRFINDAPTLVMDPVSSFAGQTFVYDAEKATWYRVSNMTIDGVSPLPETFDRLLSIGLYFAMAPRYGSTPSAVTVQTYKELRSKLSKRYRSKQPKMAPARGPRSSQQEAYGFFSSRR